jgi:hypothetical protein
MPVCLVDYNNPTIGLFEWYRTLKGDRVEQRVTESARTLGLKLKKSKYDEGMKALEAGLADALLIMRDSCVQVMNGGQDVKSAFAVVKKLENQLIASGLNVGYETASDAEKQLKTGKVDMVFAIPPIKKSDVLKQGVRDEPFPHKVTRHTVPARPLELDVPFDLLKDEKLTTAEVNRKFLDMLNSRNVRRAPAGSVIEGRRYDEEVFLFNEH